MAKQPNPESLARDHGRSTRAVPDITLRNATTLVEFLRADLRRVADPRRPNLHRVDKQMARVVNFVGTVVEF